MKHYETSFTADKGFKADAKVFPPEATSYGGHCSLSIKAPDANEWDTPIVFRLPHAMADKALRIAAAINEIMNEDAAPAAVAQAAE